MGRGIPVIFLTDTFLYISLCPWSGLHRQSSTTPVPRAIISKSLFWYNNMNPPRRASQSASRSHRSGANGGANVFNKAGVSPMAISWPAGPTSTKVAARGPGPIGEASVGGRRSTHTPTRWTKPLGGGWAGQSAATGYRVVKIGRASIRGLEMASG